MSRPSYRNSSLASGELQRSLKYLMIMWEYKAALQKKFVYVFFFIN